MNDKALEWAISYFETMAADMMLAEADPELCDMAGVAAQGLRELQQRRGQRCETCAVWEPFSDDPVFSADEELWCAELERFKPASGYCDQWRAKESK